MPHNALLINYRIIHVEHKKEPLAAIKPQGAKLGEETFSYELVVVGNVLFWCCVHGDLE